MIDALKKLGEIVLADENQDFVSSLVKEIKPELNGKKQHIVIINMATDHSTIDLDVEEISSEAIEKYLWVGNADGANSPQWYATTDNLSYLLSQTLPNLLAKAPGKEDTTQFWERIAACKEKFYTDLGKQDGPEERYRYIFDIAYIGTEESTRDVYLKKEDDVKKTLKEVTAVFYKFIKRETNLSKNEIALFTIAIDGMVLAKQPEYLILVEHGKVDSLYIDEKIGLCGVCGETKKITSNTTRLRFKYYITDKLNFAHGLDNSFSTNLTLCSACYRKILVGESLVRRKMSTRLGSLPLFIIPQFLYDTTISHTRLQSWLDEIKFNYQSIATFEKIEKMEGKIQRHLDFSDNDDSYVLNFLFYQQNQAELKVLSLIQDVSPSRITVIRNTISEVRDLGCKLFGDSNAWALDMNKIYFLFPVKVKENAAVQYREILQIYDAIFSNRMLDYNFIIGKLVELIRIYRFEKVWNV